MNSSLVSTCKRICYLVSLPDTEVARIENDGTKFYIRTNENAPQYKVITIDLADSSLAHTDLIPEVKDAKLDTVELSNETFVIVYKKNVSALTLVFRLLSDFIPGQRRAVLV